MTNLVALKIGSEYGVLSNQLLRFDPQFNIFVEDNGYDLVVRIENNTDFIPNFFGAQVSYVTGLVGKNGVGKSTLLRYVKELFVEERSDLRDRENDIIIYLENEILKVYINESRKHALTVINNSHFSRNENVFYRNYPKLFERLKNFTTLYYSNNLDLGHKEIETRNYYNISTSFLLENTGKINSKFKNKRITNSHAKFRFTELKRQLEFLNEYDSVRDELRIPFKRIDRLEIEVTEVFENEYRRLFTSVHSEFRRRRFGSFNGRFNDDFHIDEESLDIFLDYFHYNTKTIGYRFSQLKNEYKTDYNYFIVVVIIENLLFLLLKLLISDKGVLAMLLNRRDHWRELFDLIFNYIDDNRWNINRDNFRNILNKSIYFLNAHSFRSNQYPPDVSEAKINKLKVEIESLLDFESFIFGFISNGEVELNKVLFDTRDHRINSILDEYFSSNLNLKFINFSWPRLSAGEESLIAFFSRLNSIAKDISSENLLLIIDEGDLYFHPEWQRKYIFFLLEFFAFRTRDISNIQILLTTHSPFLVSDLPSDNIILLNRPNEEADVTIIDTNDVDLETFGGNIHALYSKAFFLGYSTTSEFAMQKIKKEIVDPLQTSKEIDKQKIEQLISKIGEPVLRAALTKQLNERTK